MKAKVIDTGEIIDVKWNDGAAAATCCTDIWFCEIQDKSYRERELEFVDEYSKQIDWEQRRYEISKAALNGLISDSNLRKDKMSFVIEAIELADELIKQLKNEI